MTQPGTAAVSGWRRPPGRTGPGPGRDSGCPGIMMAVPLACHGLAIMMMTHDATSGSEKLAESLPRAATAGSPALSLHLKVTVASDSESSAGLPAASLRARGGPAWQTRTRPVTVVTVTGPGRDSDGGRWPIRVIYIQFH